MIPVWLLHRQVQWHSNWSSLLPNRNCFTRFGKWMLLFAASIGPPTFGIAKRMRVSPLNELLSSPKPDQNVNVSFMAGWDHPLPDVIFQFFKRVQDHSTAQTPNVNQFNVLSFNIFSILSIYSTNNSFFSVFLFGWASCLALCTEKEFISIHPGV